MASRPWRRPAAAATHLRRDWRNGAARLLGPPLVVAVGRLTSVASRPWRRPAAAATHDAGVAAHRARGLALAGGRRV